MDALLFRLHLSMLPIFFLVVYSIASYLLFKISCNLNYKVLCLVTHLGINRKFYLVFCYILEHKILILIIKRWNTKDHFIASKNKITKDYT